MIAGHEAAGSGYGPTRQIVADLRAAERRQRGPVEWSDVYVRGLLTVLVLGGIASLESSSGYRPACLVGGCELPNLASLALTLLGVAVASTLFGRLIGPHVATPAQISLLHRAPLSRAVLLSRGRRRLYVWAGIASFGAGSVVTLAQAWPGFVPLGVLASCVLGLAISERLQLRGFGGLDRIGSTALARADDLRTSLGGASVSFDVRLLADIAMNRTRRPFSGREFGLRASGPWALAWADVLRVSTRETTLLVLGNLLLAAGVVSAVFVSEGLTLAAPLLMLGFACCLTGLRRLQTSKGLARMFPLRSVTLRVALSAVGVASAILWSLSLGVAALGAGLPALAGVLALWVALASAVRWCGVLAPDYSMGLIVTEFGVIPLGAVLTSLRGWDLLLVGVSTLVVGGVGPVSVVVCVLCVLFGFLHG